MRGVDDWCCVAHPNVVSSSLCTVGVEIVGRPHRALDGGGPRTFGQQRCIGAFGTGSERTGSSAGESGCGTVEKSEASHVASAFGSVGHLAGAFVDVVHMAGNQRFGGGKERMRVAK